MKPRISRLGAREEILSPPILMTSELVVVGSTDMSFALDRPSLAQRWSTPGQSAALFDDVLTVLRRRESAGVAAADGRDLWQIPTETPGHLRWRDFVVLATRTHLELRLHATGDVDASVSLLWPPDGVGEICGDLCLMAPSYRTRPLPPVIYGVDLSTCSIRWNRPLFQEMDAYLPPGERLPSFGAAESSRPDQFFITYGESIFACAASDGSIRWHAPFEVTYYSPSVADSKVMVALRGRVVGLDEALGAVIYDVRHKALEDTVFPKTGVVYRDRLAIPYESGHLAIVNVKDGALVNVHKSKAGLWRAAEVDGRLIVGTGDGTLLIFDESIWGL